jgi:hypothetical protein
LWAALNCCSSPSELLQPPLRVLSPAWPVIAGLGYATGLVHTIGGKLALWIHIAVALVLVPLALWVDRIELQATPWWWQPLFPVT